MKKKPESREQEIGEYIYHTGPARFSKAIHSLEGMLQGLAADSKIGEAEISRLIGWVSEHNEFIKRHPFNELIPLINSVVADFLITQDELDDIIWLCRRLSAENNYYDFITSDLQRLQGVVDGIVADGKVNEAELMTLSTWISDHEHLKCCWPYEELDSVITSVMADGKIDEKEHRVLLHFFSDFAERPGSRTLENEHLGDSVLMTGICSVCPDIWFDGRVFVFTGTSDRSSKEDFKQLILQLGGEYRTSISNQTDYLVIGASGNKCWAYSCYGRKVEKAVELRKAGSQILIIHENDFWDAVSDMGIEV